MPWIFSLADGWDGAVCVRSLDGANELEGKLENGADEVEDAFDGEADEAEGQEDKPEDGVEDEEGEGGWPAEDEEDHEKEEFHGGVLVFRRGYAAAGGGVP